MQPVGAGDLGRSTFLVWSWPVPTAGRRRIADGPFACARTSGLGRQAMIGLEQGCCAGRVEKLPDRDSGRQVEGEARRFKEMHFHLR